MSQLKIEYRIRRDGSIDTRFKKEDRVHKKDSPEAIREEIAKWSDEDPVYGAIVAGILDVLHGRSNREKDRSSVIYQFGNQYESGGGSRQVCPPPSLE